MTARKGVPLLLLHGLGGSSRDWDEVVALFPKGHKPHVIDLPGFGAAPKPPDGYDPPSLARFVLHALDDGASPRAVLAGHSLGARVAGEVAALQPARVAGLVLVSPLGAQPYGLGDRLKWKAMSRASLVRGTPESTLRNALSYGFGDDSPGKRGFVERGLKARTGPEAAASLRALEKCVDGLLEAPPLKERLRGSRMPLLLVSGEEDPLAPPDETASILKARPDARHVTIDDVGHYPMLECPKAVAGLLLDFLKTV